MLFVLGGASLIYLNNHNKEARLSETQTASVYNVPKIIPVPIAYNCTSGNDSFNGDFDFGGSSPSSFNYTEYGKVWNCKIIAGIVAKAMNGGNSQVSTKGSGAKPIPLRAANTINIEAIAYRCSTASDSWDADFDFGPGNSGPSNITIMSPNGLANCVKAGPIKVYNERAKGLVTQLKKSNK